MYVSSKCQLSQMSLLPCLYCNGGSPTMLYRGGRRRNYYKSFTEETIHQKQFFVRFYRMKKKMVMICMAAAAVMVHIECERGSRSDYYTTLHILYYVIVAIERKRNGVFVKSGLIACLFFKGWNNQTFPVPQHFQRQSFYILGEPPFRMVSHIN